MRYTIRVFVLLSLAFALVISAVSASSPAQSEVPVLFIGDSHSVQGFGKRFDELLRGEYGDQVYTRARWGSSPHWWLDASYDSPRFFDRDPGTKGERRKQARRVPDLSGMLNAIDPKLVVIELGTNLYGMLERSDRDFIRRSVSRMAAVVRASGAGCVWVGPAEGRKIPRARELHDLIQEGVGEDCLLLDSLSKTSYPRLFGDGLHYDIYSVFGPRAASEWAEKSFQEMRHALSTCALRPRPWCGRYQ